MTNILNSLLRIKIDGELNIGNMINSFISFLGTNIDTAKMQKDGEFQIVGILEFSVGILEFPKNTPYPPPKKKRR